ncbi:exosome complex protein [Chloropicon primus]|uniref:Ribosomal RNA-processing protein 42 n=1 Tax=Chloropicon primus TaxID=1764295 RepID=A0A5B8MTQ1_9CHLO|nr:exosome complex protein [Chloropicon primus]UPR02026.1 exosome complex protein [Chloropicon primus]|eukprot:QDZ22802.1 exosome complex protein [Chloropicon primus]
MATTGEDVWVAGVRGNVRQDGRENSEYRRITIQNGTIEHAQGSALVQIGDTKVLAAASLEIGEPREGRPKSGVVRVTVDCTLCYPVDGTNWRSYDRYGKDLASQVEDLYNGPRGSSKGVLDEENDLCLAEGQSVWCFTIDCVVLSDDGSLLDCLSLACRSCLCDVGIPKFEVLETNEVGPSGPEITIEEDPNQYWQLQCARVPVYVSLGLVETLWVYDLCKNEENHCRSRLTFGVDASGAIKQVVSGASGTCVNYSRNVANIIEAACLAGRKLLSSIDSVDQGKDQHLFHIGK